MAASLATVAASPPIRTQAQADLDAVVQQVRDQGCGAALPTLEALAASPSLEGLRASHLFGWCLTRAGRHQAAAEAFSRAEAHPTLRPYATLGRAAALIRTGDASSAAPLLRALVTSSSGRLRGRVLLELGAAELLLRRLPESLAALTEAAELRPDDPAAWMRLGDAAAASGRRDIARRAYSRAAWAFPGDPHEAPARAAYSRLLGRSFTPRDVAPESRLLRGKSLARSGHWDDARTEFRAVVASATAGPIAGEAWYRLGELSLRSDPRTAYRAFHRAATLGWSAAGAWYWAAQAARRAGMTAQAADAIRSLLRVEPRGFWSGRHWLGAGLRAEGAGRTADAALYYRRVIEVAPLSDDAPEARWRLGWIALRAGRFAEAESRFRVAAQTAPWRSAAARAWYWTAKAIEASGQAGRADEVAGIMRQVADQYPLTFYGQRARARLGLAAPALPPPAAHIPPREEAAPAYEELFRLGLDTDAAEAGEAAFATGRDPRIARFLAQVYARLGDIPRSVAYAEDALHRGVRDEGTWRLAYPRAYWTEVTAAAQAGRIDPLLLLSLVREESRYDPTAISPAGAVGLAQLLPSTAKTLSGDSGMSVHRLTDPATNLTLGARYIRLQLDRFDGDLRLALAAYNAGPGAARRWVGLDADPDYLVERIGFAETRAYIRRVLGSYGIYRLLW
jgi:soluble lytic murein transglycosylase